MTAQALRRSRTGGRILSREWSADSNLYLVRPWLNQSADRARICIFGLLPFLAVTGNIPTTQFGRGAFQELYRQYQADFPSTVRTMCKHVFQPTRGEQLPLMVRQAWKTMVTGRPGPVVLDLPFDDAPDLRESSANISCRCGADPEGVAKAADMLRACHN